MKLAAEWIVKNHYLGSFPSATVCYRIFRSGELAGVAVLGTAQHKSTIPNVFGPAHAKDCLLLQRFALEDVLEFNAESYFLACVRARLKRERCCGILTLEATKRRKPMPSPVISEQSSKATMPSILGAPVNPMNTFSLTVTFCPIEVSANWSMVSRAGITWRKKRESYGASKCPQAASERREWGFYWRGQLTRKQRNSGKLRYAWSLHPKIVLPKSLPYPRLRLGNMQPKLSNLTFSNQRLFS